MSKPKFNCEHCLDDECKEIAKSGGFKYWGCMLRYIHNNHEPKSLVVAMQTGIREFVSEFKCYWGGGVFLCNSPYGVYIWHFIVQMKQEKIWNYKEFQEGYKTGLNPPESGRDANPYQEPSRNRSWDCGYISGLEKAEDVEGDDD